VRVTRECHGETEAAPVDDDNGANRAGSLIKSDPNPLFRGVFGWPREAKLKRREATYRLDAVSRRPISRGLSSALLSGNEYQTDGSSEKDPG
jgi:hypothetical protein